MRFGKIPVMTTFDVWEESPSSRRTATRYRTRWKAALVFDSSTGQPIFKTLTHDLSMNGTSVQKDTDEKIHTIMTLLLAPPAIEGAPQRIIRLKSVVMSSQPFRGGFRLGLSFIQDAELDKLKAVLGKHDLSGDTLPSDAHGEGLPELL
jgi:hypothetical protein